MIRTVDERTDGTPWLLMHFLPKALPCLHDTPPYRSFPHSLFNGKASGPVLLCCH
jgi:hypothetical protein